jgi:prepilin-type N-terminal cleavage/methylation domain-containing protein
MKNRRHRGYSLIEILVVISVMLVLIALLMPWVSQARELANRVSCTANLQTWGQVAWGFARDHQGYFPAAYGFGGGSNYANAVQNNNYNGVFWLMGLNNDSSDENSADDGVDWHRYGTPYSTFLTYGGTGYSTLNINTTASTPLVPTASAYEGLSIPYLANYDPTSWGLNGGLNYVTSGNTPPAPTTHVNLAKWMICPSCPFTNQLYATDQSGEWGYIIVDSYMYMGGTTYRTSNAFTSFSDGSGVSAFTNEFGNGTVLLSGFNNNLTPTWGNRENMPAATDHDSPNDVLATDAVVWGGGGFQGNMYLINHPQNNNALAPAYEGILYADGHVNGVGNPAFYDPTTNTSSNNLTVTNWAGAHMPDLEGRQPTVYIPTTSSLYNSYGYLDTWNYTWTGWYFYWPNEPGGS